jgi:hypothetical protein
MIHALHNKILIHINLSTVSVGQRIGLTKRSAPVPGTTRLGDVDDERIVWGVNLPIDNIHEWPAIKVGSVVDFVDRDPGQWLQ